MKLFNILKNIIITFIIVGMFFIFAYQQTHYVRIGHCVLKSSYGVNNTYTFTDSTGEEYTFTTIENISPYDTIKVDMFNNCTEENVEDDVIIKYTIVPKIENEN